MTRTQIGWLLALLSVIIFSTNTPVAKGIIGQGMSPITLVAARFVGAALLFGVVLSLTSLGNAGGDEKPLDRRIVLIALGSGAVNGLTLASFYTALTVLDASLTSVLGIALFPTMTLFILAARGEPLTRKKLLRLAIVMVGLYFLIGLNGEINGRGLFFILIAASTYAFHLATVQWYMKAYNTWAMTGVMMTGAGIIVTLLWLVNGAPTFVPGLRGWLVILYQVVILTFFGRTIIYAAIDRIGSGQVALLTPIETVLTIIWSILFLGETLTPRQTIGAALVLLSALLAAELKKKVTAEKASHEAV